jgi:hypothetical protein
MIGSKFYQSIIPVVFSLIIVFCLALPASALVTNYRSIGTNTDMLYYTGSASIEAGSATVDFGPDAGLPSNIGQGDRIIINDEIFYILSRESDTRVTLQSNPGETHTDAECWIERAYHTLQAWESARDGNLVRDDRREVGVCYNDGPFHSNQHKQFSLLTINGSRTDADHYMWLTVAEGQRHNGVAGSGVVLDGDNRVKYGVRIKDDYTRVEWLEMKRFRRWNGSASVQVKKAKRVLLGQLLIHDFYSRRSSTVGIKGSRRSNFTARNCIIYDGDKAAIRTNKKGGTALIENCTIYGMDGRGIFEDRGRYTVLNTISMGNRKEDFKILRGVQGFNISSDDTASGPTSFIYLDAGDQFVSIMPGEENFHLNHGAKAIDAAANLSVTFSEDIDGPERPQDSKWDIGADEYRIYSSGIWYVDSEKYGNGTSWEEAFETVQQAVEAAKTGDEIWVKMGTYSLLSEIVVDKSVSLYGGFEGTETQREQRNFRLYETVLDGQDAVRCLNIQSDGVTVDGFIISNGYEDMGGGVYASASSNFKISNCVIQNNHANFGGGVFSETTQGEIINCSFIENTAEEIGGGAYILDSAVNMTNSIFSKNEAMNAYGPGGGGIFNSHSDSVITNCTFFGNAARNDSEGGAIYNQDSYPEITNSILWGNIAEGYGPELVDDWASESKVAYSNIDWPGLPGTNGNIREEPKWVKPDENDFHLQSNSPCINKGTNNGCVLPETDFEGDPRIVDENVDMGVDEFVN